MGMNFDLIICVILKNIVLSIYNLWDVPFQDFKTISF